MGTQQLLLIVLGVIIVGVAIAVGIGMFQSQAYNSNKQALSVEMLNYATYVLQFWKTPRSMGGAGQVVANLETTACANYIGFSDAEMSTSSENGEFRLISIVGSVVTLKALGREKRDDEFPVVTVVVDVTTGQITTDVSTATGWD
jgi:hypothetical protein